MLSGVDEVLGHVPQLEVEGLGGSAQDVEGLVGGDALALDEDSLGLAEHRPGGQCGLEVVVSAFVVVVAVAEARARPARPLSRSPLARSMTPKACG